MEAVVSTQSTGSEMWRVLWCVFFLFSAVRSNDTLVSTTSGEVEGFWKTPSCLAFYGIPYAEPPIGPLRFNPPQKVTPWSGVRSATNFSSPCIQPNISLPGPGSEDCLYLNVYVPVVKNQILLPVMIWIHGGGFQVGAGSSYDGSELATKGGVVVVTLNYRLNVFGFFQSNVIREANPSFPTLGGMNGILDQVLAIEWVKANAIYFGGNPEKITIFGESAGSLSVEFLISSPLVPKGLFLNAIMESGSILGPWGPLPSDNALKEGTTFMKKVGMTTLEGLQKLDVSVFTSYSPSSLWYPSLDDYFYPKSPRYLFGTGNLNIPSGGAIIIGANTLDTLFAQPWYNGPYPETPSALRSLVEQYFGNVTVDSILEMYPPDVSPQLSFQLMNRDVCVICPTRSIVLSVASFGKIPIYLYLFGFNPVPSDHQHYASHGAEVSLVFGVPMQIFDFNRTLSNSIINFWTSFSEFQVPSDPVSNLDWPEWKQKNQIMYFDEESRLDVGYNDEVCQFWNKFSEVSARNYGNVFNFCQMKVYV
eukprot:TRINITY_DN11405_c0_g2_i2.p1 TRINITY_DN11405_c0_g2~~TRINITY_DN11405_c0_g2_i2.p1  ORF type:complete len:533 (+),score=99.92 TRINITY_DN11405_c0_g2_i2:34-1632(+)